MLAICVVAIGVLAICVVAIGVLAIGVVAIGAVAIGAVAIGAVAIRRCGSYRCGSYRDVVQCFLMLDLHNYYKREVLLGTYRNVPLCRASVGVLPIPLHLPVTLPVAVLLGNCNATNIQKSQSNTTTHNSS